MNPNRASRAIVQERIRICVIYNIPDPLTGHGTNRTKGSLSTDGEELVFVETLMFYSAFFHPEKLVIYPGVLFQTGGAPFGQYAAPLSSWTFIASSPEIPETLLLVRSAWGASWQERNAEISPITQYKISLVKLFEIPDQLYFICIFLSIKSRNFKFNW